MIVRARVCGGVVRMCVRVCLSVWQPQLASISVSVWMCLWIFAGEGGESDKECVCV